MILNNSPCKKIILPRDKSNSNGINTKPYVQLLIYSPTFSMPIF